MNNPVMKVGIFVLVASLTSAQSIAWDDLRVTFSFGDPSAGFFRLPRTVSDANLEGWSKPPEVNNAIYQTLCPDNDPSVCLIYSQQGDVNGIEIGIQAKDVANSSYPFSKHPMFVRGLRFGYDVYIVTVYTVKPGTVNNGEPRLETGDGVWMDFGPEGVRNFEIPRLSSGMAATKFTLQNCIPAMGTHYYYNISPTLSCDDFEPMFALYQDQEMIGFGIQTWGKPTHLSRNWFEPVPKEAIKPTVPNSPECMTDLTGVYGLVSLHVYFVDEPWNIKC